MWGAEARGGGKGQPKKFNASAKGFYCIQRAMGASEGFKVNTNRFILLFLSKYHCKDPTEDGYWRRGQSLETECLWTGKEDTAHKLATEPAVSGEAARSQ